MSDTKQKPKPLTANCKYRGNKFEYYVRTDKPVNCLKTECIQKAIANGVYKDFKGKRAVVV